LSSLLSWFKLNASLIPPSTGVHFINVLLTAFTLVGPKSVKRYWRLEWVLTLWGATGVKAVGRTLMKSSPGVNFINVCSTSSFCLHWSRKCKKDWQLDCLFASLGSASTKTALRTLMKLTPDWGVKEQNVCNIITRCQFLQHFSATFLYKSVLRSFSLVTIWLWIFLAQKYGCKSCL